MMHHVSRHLEFFDIFMFIMKWQTACTYACIYKYFHCELEAFYCHEYFEFPEHYRKNYSKRTHLRALNEELYAVSKDNHLKLH